MISFNPRPNIVNSYIYNYLFILTVICVHVEGTKWKLLGKGVE
uniref:Uncharacterized protein n=1 Tax=Lepeophtheirus salmonis TaxID=72036 RepID=A0A0K2TLP3_LEPSM